METAAVDTEGLVIPLIDFSAFLTGTPSSRRATATALLHGFQTAGFVYLSNLPPSLHLGPAERAAAFAASAAFFAQPAPAKEALGWTTPRANRGYSAPGREKTTDLTDPAAVEALRRQVPDVKESFEIGREGEDGCPNQWPEEDNDGENGMAGFRQTMLDFHARCQALHVEVMRAIAVGLNSTLGGADNTNTTCDEHFFDPYLSTADNTLRLLHYPSVPRAHFAANPSAVRAGAHTDYGSVTLLFQDARGGLQVRAPSGAFVDATPIEDAVVVNAGDLLARWSNDTIRSTVHRVVEPPMKKGEEVDEYPPRYSIAYFCNPNFDSHIEAIPGTYATDADRKYQGINSGEYIFQRLAATY